MLKMLIKHGCLKVNQSNHLVLYLLACKQHVAQIPTKYGFRTYKCQFLYMVVTKSWNNIEYNHEVLYNNFNLCKATIGPISYNQEYYAT
jgi:hypothetical protein